MQRMRLLPTRTLPARKQPLSLLPVFMDLRGRRVVIAGDPEQVADKAELAAAAGAEVQVFTIETTDDLAALASAPPAGRVDVVPRAWMPDDLEGAALAIGALTGDEAEDFATIARLRGVPVNIVGCVTSSTVQLGAIVNRSPVVVAISTDDAAPVIAEAIRTRIEALLDPAIASWAAAARAVRATMRSRIATGVAYRAAWGDFAKKALTARRGPDEGDLDVLSGDKAEPRGSIVIVGAGPGDPDLLTIKAMRALQSADVILYDRLVAPEILELASREARRMLVGKAGGGPACSQDDINRLMVSLARSGKRVARLKGGDPTIFGRLAEELDAAAAAGVPVEVVPGITAAIGAAASLNMPLTDRRSSKRLQLVSGHAESGDVPEHDWSWIAQADTTTAFYMSARTFGAMSKRMIAAGCPVDRKVVVVWAATTPRARTLSTTVGGVASIVSRGAPGDPCLIIVGEVTARADIDHGDRGVGVISRG